MQHEIDNANYYAKLYGNQSGGNFPVFAGSRYSQYGQGFGAILRGIFRFALPVVARGASSFLEGLVSNREAGKDWKESAKSALGASAKSAMSQAGTQFAQQGHGRKRKRKITFKKRILYKAKKLKASPSHKLNF